MNYFNVKLGQILVDLNMLTQEQLDKALEEQKGKNKRLGEILVDGNYINERQLVDALKSQLHLPYIDVTTLKIDSKVASLIPESVARANLILPIDSTDRIIKIAVYDPLNYSAIHDIEVYTGLTAELAICEKSKIISKIKEIYTTQRIFDAAKTLSETAAVKTKINEIDSLGDDRPIISFINSMIERAVILKASDIHIEPYEKEMVVRFRIDGHLTTYISTGIEIFNAVVSRIKYIGGMNIAERRLPQDGRNSYRAAGTEVDLRISVLPSIYGEKVVIRITTSLSFDIKKENIGFSKENLEKFNKMIRQPYGIVLLTGPTGSGKSTTLYTALNEINRSDINIVTVENPVEMVMKGITQVNINNASGLNFSTVLRSVLRQDPDVIMIGEIRDHETAEIAASMAITGHLVFSTLHTYDAASAVVRLVDIGVAPFMVASSVVGVIAQRLIRKICPHCKTSYIASIDEKKTLGFPITEKLVLYKGNGCNFCSNTGYLGRTAVHEIMNITSEIRDAVAQHRSAEEIRDIAIAQGMITLENDAKEAAITGVTTLREISEACSL